jgi:hypothetical protein
MSTVYPLTLSWFVALAALIAPIAGHPQSYAIRRLIAAVGLSSRRGARADRLQLPVFWAEIAFKGLAPTHPHSVTFCAGGPWARP